MRSLLLLVCAVAWCSALSSALRVTRGPGDELQATGASAGPAATGATGASAAPAATAGADVGTCHSALSCDRCSGTPDCVWSPTAESGIGMCSTSCTSKNQGDCVVAGPAAKCPLLPTTAIKSCQVLKVCNTCLQHAACAFTQRDGCLDKRQLSKAHENDIQSLDKCPAIETTSCASITALKGEISPPRCEQCIGSGCQWNMSDKKCEVKCFDNDRCVRSTPGGRFQCPTAADRLAERANSPLLRKDGPKFVTPNGLGIH